MLLARRKTATVNQLESAREQQIRGEGHELVSVEHGAVGGLLPDGLGCQKEVTTYKVQGSAYYGQIVQPFMYVQKML